MRNYLLLEENTLGRDFVVGDIHGCFDNLFRALEEIRFDSEKDRLISVGDLIDRGPESHKSLRFLNMPGVYAIRGNHEDIYLRMVGEEGDVDHSQLPINIQNGMAWVMRTPKPIRAEIRKAFEKLPIAIETPTARGSVGFVHADIPEKMDWRTFIDKISLGDEKTIHTALWGRKRINEEHDAGVEGIDRVFVGHTPQENGVKRLGNIYYIDTGAVFDQMSNQTTPFHMLIAQTTGGTITFENSGPQSSVVHGILNGPHTESRPFGSYTRKPKSP